MPLHTSTGVQIQDPSVQTLEDRSVLLSFVLRIMTRNEWLQLHDGTNDGWN